MAMLPDGCVDMPGLCLVWIVLPDGCDGICGLYLLFGVGGCGTVVL